MRRYLWSSQTPSLTLEWLVGARLCCCRRDPRLKPDGCRRLANFDAVSVTAVPEPSTALLLFVGAIAGRWMRRKNARKRES